MACLVKNLLELFKNISGKSPGNWLGRICGHPALVVVYKKLSAINQPILCSDAESLLVGGSVENSRGPVPPFSHIARPVGSHSQVTQCIAKLLLLQTIRLVTLLNL